MSASSNRLLRRVTRLDFLEGLGVSIGRRSVAFARLVKRMASVSLQEHRVVALPPPEDPVARRAALTAAVRAFLDETEGATDRVYVSVPRSLTIVSRLSLPASVKADLEQVVEFEADRLLPLARDEVYLDHLVRDAGEKVEILLVGLPRRAAAEILDALEDGGAHVRSLVTTPLAMQDFIAFTPAGAEGPLVTVVDDGGSIELAELSGGELVASHVLRPGEVTSEASVGGIVRREIDQMVGASADTPVYGIAMEPEGTGTRLPSDLLGRGRELLEMARGLLRVPEGFFDSASPALVPAIGAGLAAVREGATDLNLLPADERRAVEEGAPVVTFFLAAVLVVVTVVWLSSALVKDHLILSGLRTELAALEPRMRQVHAHEAEIDALQEKMKALAEGENVRNALFLQELTRVVPRDAYLTTFRMRNGRVELEGFANSASDLVPLLEKSRLFKNAQFTSPVTKVQNNQERFSLSTDLAR